MSDLLLKKLSGFHLIDASAGTGKTYTITALVVRLLLEKGYGLSEILIVTYTEAAAQDLRKRVRETLVQMRQGYESGQSDDDFIQAMISRVDLDSEVCLKRIQLGLNEFDEAAIFTIHSFCQRTLQENGLESGMAFNLELEKDMAPHQHQVASDYWRRISVDLPPGFLFYCGNKLYPQALVHRFRQLRPELDIIPDVSGVTNLTDREERYTQGVTRLAGGWLQSRDDVFDVLAQQTSLKKTSYKPEKISSWFPILDDFFADQSANLTPPPKCFKNFTVSGLQVGLKKNCPAVEHPFFALAEELWQDWLQLEEGYQDQLLYLQRQFYTFARQELDLVKDSEGILSFDDLLVRLARGLAGSGGTQLAAHLRNQYPAILIDEFQDTDPVQFKIFKAIHAGIDTHLLYLIGDPKQAIYNFRGADIFAYLKAADTVKNRESLSYNYRSEDGLIQAVNHLFSGHNPFLIEGIDFEPALAPDRAKDQLFVAGDDPAYLHILFGEREPAADGKKQKGMKVEDSRLQVAKGCCGEITRLLDLAEKGEAMLGDKPVQPQDIAILVRENKDARFLQRLLLEHGVASVVKDSENLFGAPQARDLFHVLQGVASYRDQRRLITALATDCLGWSAMDLHLLQDDDEGWDDVMSRFQQYHELWLGHGFMAMFQGLLAGEQIRERLLARVGGERDLTNILHLGELLHRQAKKNPAISSLLDFCRTHLEGDSKDDEFEQRLESDSKRLQILTIHKSKGLEFPIVFCPFLWKGLRRKQNDIVFHTDDQAKQLTLDLGSDDIKEHKLLAQFEEQAENLRLAYVALTRATNRCVVQWGGYDTFATSPLGYLLHDNGEGFAKVAKELKKSSDADLRRVVGEVAHGAKGTIVIRDNPTVIQPFVAASASSGMVLSLAHFQADLDRSWQVTSFSKLTSGQHHESFIVDRDQVDDGTLSFTSAALTLFDFPRGANPGTFLHYLFEYLDFTTLGTPKSQLFIQEGLGQFGYEEKWLPVMEKMLDDVCQVVLPQQNFCLADIHPAKRLNELEFHFPLAQVNSRDWADLFRQHGTVGGESWYSMVESYGFQLVQGFLKGFVDLIFRRDDRYFIIDWKSNYLGNHHGAYGHEAMTDSMVQSGYILQYHLYSLALHRYLGSRLDDYDYERHFGGVVYVYLRGVTKKDNNTGLFWDRPDKGLMDDLHELFTDHDGVQPWV